MRAVELAAGQQDGHPGHVLEGLERVLPVGHHGQLAGPADGPGQALQGRRGVHSDGAAVADQVGQLGGDAVLGPGLAAEPLGERLGPEGDGAAADPLDHPLLGEQVEVAADGHLADLQLLGQLGDLDPAGDADPVLDLGQPVDGLDAHRSPAVAAAGAAVPAEAGARWARASARSA